MTRSVAHLLAGAAALTLSLVPARLPAQIGFEGVTTFNTYSGSSDKDTRKPTTMLQTTKGHKVRFEGLGGESSKTIMVFDGDSKSMMIIDPDKKQYVTVTQEDMKQMAAMMGAMADKMKGTQSHDDAAGSRKFDFSKTGRTETVAGVSCEVYHGSSEYEGRKHEGEACIATGAGFALFDVMLDNPMVGQRSNMPDYGKFRELLSGGKGILKMTKIENGKSSVEMEAVKIERRPVADDAFLPPAGYTGQTMSAMMQQMRGAMQQMQQPPKPKP